MYMFRSLVLLLVGAILSSSQLFAQTTNPSWATYKYTKQLNPWLSTLNPAGLITYSAPSISDLNFRVGRDNGGLVDYYESNDSFELSADANSLYKFSDRVMLSGEVGYSYFTGKNVSGSALFNPYYNTFDITDFDSENRGNITQERYNISGGVAWAATKRLSIGADFSLLGANYAKMKDLRHINYLTDIDLQLGVTYSLTDFMVGISYALEHHIEAVSFNRFYDTDYAVSMLRSYGLFWGKRDTFSSSTGLNFISSSSLPIINFTSKFALQLSYNISPSTMILLEGVYSLREGQIGIQENESPIFNTFDINSTALNLRLVSNRSDSRHIAALSYESQGSFTYENKFNFVNDGLGGTYLEYQTPSHVSTINNTTLNLDYILQLGIADSIPKYEVALRGEYMTQDRSATIFPFSREDNSSMYSVGLDGRYNIVSGRGVFCPSVALNYYSGLGAQYIDKELSTGVVTNPTKTADEFMLKQMEYQQSEQLAVGLGFGYMYSYSKLLKIRAMLDCSYRFALEEIVNLSSDYKYTINLTLGVIF